MVSQKVKTVFDTDIFADVLLYIKENSTKFDERLSRIVADHTRSAVMIISDGAIPSNTEAGYVLRRILRRDIRFIDQLGMPKENLISIAELFINKLSGAYPTLVERKTEILQTIKNEDEKFRKTLAQGLKEFEKGVDAFDLFQSYGFPVEMTLELAKEKGIMIDMNDFNEKMKKHQEISKAGSEQKFKGGLAGTGEMETKYHTATHLLNAALRQVLGEHVFQKGSNITAERLRFDFAHTEKLTDEQKNKVEDYVNGVIALRLPVTCKEMKVNEAKESGAQGVFTDKYDNLVKVYTVGPDDDHFSKEICGGPHVVNTGELGRFKIVKEEASSAGVRRIKAVLE